MPLLVSPIDGSPMKQITRHGIEIDVCPTTGGVWLDRGELEKLLAIVREEVEAQEAAYQAARPAAPPPRQQQAQPVHYQQPHPQQQGYYKKYDDDDWDDRHKYGHGYKKKSKLKSILDIFD
jgi:Zn-finger nucleic acid-binding protein